MSNRSARMIILCEDTQQYSFVYRLLKSLGFPPGAFASNVPKKEKELQINTSVPIIQMK